jgi:hypothetical protein
MSVKVNHFPNKGWLQNKLSKEDLNHLNKYIKNKTKKVNHRLAGNISKSYDLEDKDNWFFTNVLTQCIIDYQKAFGDTIPGTLTKNCRLKLDRFWVNFQKKYEFNPLHSHSGVFSFVVWIKIPSSYKQESKLPFIKHANFQMANTFQLLYMTALGDISPFDFHLDPQFEGTMLFFPSRLSHCVYPFYTSNKERISISGNISLNPEEIISRNAL